MIKKLLTQKGTLITFALLTVGTVVVAILIHSAYYIFVGFAIVGAIAWAGAFLSDDQENKVIE